MDHKGKRPVVSIDQLESGLGSVFNLLYHRNPQPTYAVKSEFLKSSGIKPNSVTAKRFFDWMRSQQYLVWDKRYPDRVRIESFWKSSIVARQYYSFLTGIHVEIPKETPTEPSKNAVPIANLQVTEIDGGGKRITPGKKVYFIKDNRCKVGTYYGYILKDGVHKVMVDDEWRDVSEIYRSKNDFDEYVMEMLTQVRISGNET